MSKYYIPKKTMVKNETTCLEEDGPNDEPRWEVVAIGAIIIDDALYGKDSKRILGVKNYARLPKWEYEFINDGSIEPGQKNHYKYLMAPWQGIGRPRKVLARKVCVYGRKLADMYDVPAMEEAMDTARKDMRLHQIKRMYRCKHGRIIQHRFKGADGEGRRLTVCVRCRLDWARLIKRVANHGPPASIHDF